MKKNSLIKSIGDEIKYHRTAKNISLSSLAKEANISKSTLFALELGDSNPTIATLESICNALNIDLDSLLKSHTQESAGKKLIPVKVNSESSKLYTLELNPFEKFSYTTQNSSAITIELINGAATLLDTQTTLTSDLKISLPHSFRLQATKSGATILIRVEQSSPLFLESDIFLDTITPQRVQELSIDCYSSKIKRIVLPKSQKISQTPTIPYIKSLLLATNKHNYLYLFSRYQGIRSLLKELKEKFNFTPKQTTQTLIETIIEQTTLSKNSISKEQSHPLLSLETELLDTLKKNFNSLQIVSPQYLLTNKLKKQSIYCLIAPLLDSNTYNLVDESFILNLSLAAEEIHLIDEEEFNTIEQKLYKKLTAKLLKAHYLSLNNNIPIAATILEELQQSIQSFFDTKQINHPLLKLFYTELLKKLETTLSYYTKQEQYIKREVFETLIQEKGVIIEKKVLLQSTVNGGRYLYLLKVT